MLLLLVVAIVFVVGVFTGAMAKGGGSTYTQRSSPEDSLVREMKLQRARDYFNNPVVKELQREEFFKNRQ